jgi:integrase
MNNQETRILQMCISVLMLLLNRSETERRNDEMSEEEKNALTQLIGAARELSRNTKKELDGSELEFTKKEYNDMPILKDCTVRVKPNGVTEYRYRREGIEKSFSSKDPKEARRKAVAYLKALTAEYRANEMKQKEEEEKRRLEEERRLRFAAFAERWLQVEKKPYLKEITYESYRNDLNKHILPTFGQKKLSEITYIELQEFINGYIAAEQCRLAKKLRNLLQQIFTSAVEQEQIERSPAARLKEVVYETKNGEAFTRAEEDEFVEKLLKSEYDCKYALLLVLYTGIRRDELKSVTFDAARDWVYVKNGKTKKGRSSMRKIPVCPILKKYIHLVSEEAIQTKNDYLSRMVPTLTNGKHHLHELRHTFISRCQECGIPAEVVSRWVGHSRGNNMTDKVYTHFSDEYQLEIIKKLNY